MFYLETLKGTIRIEINDPMIKVTLDESGASFEGADKTHSVRVESGSHGLKVTRGDFTFHTPEFELSRGKEIRLSVQYLSGKVRVVKDAKEVLHEEPLPEYVLEFDGIDDYVELPTLKLDTLDQFTMEIWADVENPADSPQLLHWSGLPGRRAKIQLGVPVGPDRPNLMGSVHLGERERPADKVTYSTLRFDETFAAGSLHVALCRSANGDLALYWNGKPCPKPLSQGPLPWPPGVPSMIGGNFVDAPKR